jgi:hypothetical protein
MVLSGSKITVFSHRWPGFTPTLQGHASAKPLWNAGFSGSFPQFTQKEMLIFATYPEGLELLS